MLFYFNNDKNKYFSSIENIINIKINYFEMNIYQKYNLYYITYKLNNKGEIL